MKTENNLGFKNGIIAKVTILAAIVVIIAAIWLVKNAGKPNSDNSDFALHVTQEINLEQLKAYGVPIIIDFGADSCIPCKEMAPVLQELNEELKGKAIIKFVDVWKYQSLAQNYPISLIPTQIFFDAEGKPFTPDDTEKIPFNLYTTKDTNEHALTTHEGGLTKEELLNTLKKMGMK